MDKRAVIVAIIIGMTLPGLGADTPAPPPFWGFTLDGYPITAAKLTDLRTTTGLRPDIIVFFLQWPRPGVVPTDTFPRESLDAIWNQGAAPCITWEPMTFSQGKAIAVPYRQILDGTYDPYLRAFAGQAKAWDQPFMIRFAHEMNLERYHWGTEIGRFGAHSPGIYRQMFHYIVTLFRKEGATNVRWVFCPNAESIPNPDSAPQASWNRARNYYPGDKWVDILGMDGYNWGTTQTKVQHGWDSRWMEFERIFQDLHKELKAMAPAKPIMVFETACVNQGGNRMQWIMRLTDTARQWDLKGLCWFQVNKEQDWRLQHEYAARIAKTRKPGVEGQAQQWLRNITP